MRDERSGIDAGRRARGSGRRGAVAALAAALAAAAVLAYLPVRSAGFLLYDDAANVSEHPLVRSGLTWPGLRWALSSTEQANWFPLTRISHLADAQLYGMRAAGHHLTNLALHAVNSALVFLVARSLTGALGPSALVAALFALHPLHVESVAWVTQRKDLLCAFFWLLAVAAHGRYARAPSPRRYLPVLALSAAALLSKPLAVTLPFALLLLDFWPLGRWRGRSSWRALLAEKAPLLLAAAAVSTVTYHAQSSAGALGHVAGASLAQRVAQMPLTYLRYLGKTLWPERLFVLYPFEASAEPPWALAAAWLALGAATALCLFAGRRRGYPAVGWLWFLGVLVPMIGIVQVGGQTMADRYTYLPHLGLFVVFAFGAREVLAGRPGLQRALLAACLVLLGALGAQTRRQTLAWRSTVTLFAPVVDAFPGHWGARYLLGVALSREGRVEEANAELAAALALFPGLEGAQLQIGLNHFRRGRAALAAEHLARELAAHPRNVAAHLSLGQALGALGRLPEAQRHFAEAARLDPANASARFLLGTAAAEEGRWAEAAQHFLAAARLDPADARAPAKAREALQRAGTR